ncbi:MAG TPA: asparagine--tRNA ligase, partial [Saprospiraceae bacterium]|nr:asparagine--tRNA ligase [Saprospiraceae bacterium]
LINYILQNFPDDIAFLDKRLQDEQNKLPQDQRRAMGLLDTLKFVVENDFERITYTEAVKILRDSKPFKKGKFEFEPSWGKDLQAEHERYLVEKHFQKPVIVRNYPKAIKAFYMRQNERDPDVPGETVAAMDVLFPGIGEVIGGSQREERLEKLRARIHEMHLPEEDLWWYLDLRRFGGAPHAGFGLGFERMVQFITGMGNIRDVIPFPRAPGSAEF